MKVIPPNFGYVEEGIFRCGAPEPRHYGFLASLGLRTCILLTDTHDSTLVHWLQESGVMIFCPLSSEAQTRGSFRGGPLTTGSVSAPENLSFPQQRGGGREGVVSGNAQLPGTGGNASSVNNSNSRDDGREDANSPNSGYGDGLNPTAGSGRLGPGDSLYANKEGADGADGGEGGAEGIGNQVGDGAYCNNHNAATNSGGTGLGASRGGWRNQTNHGVTASGTSNAARFLRENVVERQISTRFSPVVVQEPMYFPGGARNGGGGPYQFVTAPSYEGRLHGLMTLSEAVVVSILHILLDPQYYPLLITCSKGRYRSGIVCGCLRKLQGWNLVSILEEYRRFAGNKSRADNEEFIELFDEELVNLELPDGRRPTLLYNM
ncbi:hypothetical protein ABL78_3594 [Leptomonas seymouri]|uniref:protein-tyrosine-phosphatase n=1 Tax=Leptomonas seymouri TaxID=5684 RepID=A0A0N1IKW7_LEPSE|nr:hypothetical protein ABL78_3594 [Leptomonas seymouri]|eukprot:KPI87311.1 hypothetical protein ABL78_3594 [Leptomonas seymouri]